MITLTLTFAIITTKIQVQGASADDVRHSSINRFIESIPREDVLGSIATVVDQFLGESNRGRPPPKSDNCKTRLLKFGEFEAKISIHPLGYCSYCCQIIKPTQHIRLRFSNKLTGSQSIEIKMLRKEGLLKSSGVNINVTSIFFIHGFTEHGLGPAPNEIRDAYLSRAEDYNIFMVDWGELTAFPWYPQAAVHTKLLGNILAKFIDFYHSTGELSIKRIHVIGFSLGAHAAGFIGKYLNQEKLPRITALDPALPLFPIDDNAGRVSIHDAEFVDVIHTDGGKFGFPVSVGHADFYPNGGSFIQPGCSAGSLAENRFIEQIGTCDHLRAWKLYAESVRNPYAFPATQSSMKQNNIDGQFKFITEAYMGFGVNTSSTRGDFYLLTNGNYPYSKTAEEQENVMNKKAIPSYLNKYNS